MSSQAKALSIIISVVAVLTLGAFLLWNEPATIPTAKANPDPKVVRENSWRVGKNDAKVTLTEFADLQCPACASVNPLIKSLKDQYKDNQNVSFVYRHYPLSIHKNARHAAFAAEAAGKQNKFFEMTDQLFQAQKDWESSLNPDGFFVEVAIALGLNKEQFEKDYNDINLRMKVVDDTSDALGLKLESTPSFFLNNDKVSITSINDATKMIDEALSK